MSTPGHAHAITIKKNPHRIKVMFNGTVVADTKQALVLKEGPLSPVNYIPREDVQLSYLHQTNHSTHCPFKGNASYFSLSVNGKTADNAIWTYETPIDAVAQIKDYVVFYPEKMDAIEELPLD